MTPKSRPWRALTPSYQRRVPPGVTLQTWLTRWIHHHFPGYARAQNKAASISDPNKKFSMNLFFLIVCLVKIIARTAYEDIVAFGNLVRAQDELDWTIVRVPNLRDGEKMDAFAGSIGQAGVFHDRMAFASFTVKELLEPQWMKKNVAISS